MKRESRTRTTTRRLSAFGIALILSGITFARTMQTTVADSAAEAMPLKVGARAPDASLRGLDGKAINLHKVLGGRPSVVIFYRGGWCPFCNRHLSDLASIEGDIERRGYQIVAISPDSPEELNKTLTKDHLPYKLFSDSSAEAMMKFGVAFRLDDATFTKYRDNYHIDIEGSSGKSHHILPVPSVFIVDKGGKIIFVHSNPDYKVRLKGSEILTAIDSQ